MPGIVSSVFGIASMAFPPLAILGPAVTAFEIALDAYKQWDKDAGVRARPCLRAPSPPPYL